MKTFNLTEDQRTTITNALTIAAERYTENAQTIRGLAPPHNIESLAEQFDRQAVDARAMAELIDGAGEITIEPYVEREDWTVPKGKRVTLADIKHEGF